MSATKIQTFYENNIYFSKKRIIMLSKIMPSDLGHTILKFHFYVPDLGQTYAHRAIICPSFDTVIAPHTKLCLRFGTDLCTPCNDMLQIRDRFLHTGQ